MVMIFGKSKEKNGYKSGITPRSLAAMVLCMLLSAMYTNYSCTYLHEHYQVVESAIPLPAIIALLFATLLVGIMALLTKCRLLTRAELVCIAFATMISAPMMAEGFWQRFFGIIAAVPRARSFDFIDVYDDGLWPHGKNLFEGAFDGPGPAEPSCGDFTNKIGRAHD